ncbi:putative f-box domain protein [Mycena sanguinolenta]|uniref:Putative f-box domain protein n=1 Tax=Mycena sanguinolenta TaxID=230812 RepID=A0A8H7CWV8_9AGAR|nr:putative f-box domain protein [Mycena sanguinolenta]
MSKSRDEVLSTPELVELTLSHLPIRDLLVTAPLVCQTWRAITLTPVLQRALFFEPDPSFRSERLRNPLLMEIFAPFFTPEARSHWDWPDAGAIKSMPWSKAPDAFNRPEASWRRMLVSQPLPQKLLVTEIYYRRGGARERRAVLDNQPLRMEPLYDITLPLVDRVASSFCVHWQQDVTLAVAYTQQRRWGSMRVLDMRFYSTLTTHKTNLEFGKWSLRSPTP